MSDSTMIDPSLWANARAQVTRGRSSSALSWLGVALCCASLLGCGWVYQADPIHAWVVDAEDGHPLAGVHVVAWWRLKGGMEGGMGLGYVELMETVTDEKGEFSFPGWGPRLILQPGDLTYESPTLMIYTPGYRLRGATNSRSIGPTEVHLRSEWNEKRIPLELYRGTLVGYADNLSMMEIHVDDILATRPCLLLEMPKMLIALSEQRTAFARAGLNRGPNSLESLERNLRSKSCGSLIARAR